MVSHAINKNTVFHRCSLKFWLATLFCFVLTSSSWSYASGWDLIDRSDGVSVYAREVPGTDLVAFKGHKVMPVSIGKIIALILNEDVEEKKRWIDMIMDFRILSKRSQKVVTYTSFDLPWPVEDRDFIVESSYRLERVQKQFILDIRSVEPADAPPTIGVRGRIFGSKYILTAIGASQTRVEVEILADPMGLLPDWLINLIQRSWPHNTLLKMENMVQKPGAPTHPLGKFLEHTQVSSP